jgi:WD40 repeat protein/beta-lactamase regulating signal transducer with metallopeptidase domain
MDVPEKLLAGIPWLGMTLVQVTAVAVLGLLAWAAARRRGPALRGAVVLAALVGLLAVPAIATVAPVWLPLPEVVQPPVVKPEPPKLAEAVRPPLPPPDGAPVVSTVLPKQPPEKVVPGPDDLMEPFDDFDPFAEDFEPAVTAPVPASEAAPPAEPGEPRRAAAPVASILVTVWLVGALAYLARALVCLALLYHRAWWAESIPEEEWVGCVAAPADRGGRPAVALRESPAVDSPLTLGLFRPVILLPAGWRCWSDEQLGLVVAHELAHVRRRDFLAGLAAELAVCLCWFHPLVRWLAGRLRLEQEYAADAWAASAAGNAMTYVRCLARLALERGTGRASLAPAFWRRRPEIFRRIDMLRGNRDGLSLRLGRPTAGAVVVLAAAACVAVAGVGPLRPIADDPAKPVETAAEVKAVAATADTNGDALPAGALARLGTTRWRHGATITYVAFGPEGKTLITAGQDNTVRLWDMATGKEIRRFAPPRPEGRPVPGRPLGLPGVPGVLAPVPVPPAPGRPPAPVAAPVPVPLAAARQQVVKPGPDAEKTAAEKAAAAKAQAEKAAAEAEKARAELRRQVEAAAARQQALMPGGGSSFLAAATPDGKTLAVSSITAIQLYEVETGKELHKIVAPAGLVGLLFSPDSKTLAARGADGSVTLWDADTGKERQQIKAPPRPNTARPQVIEIRAGGGATPGMAFASDGTTLAVATTEIKEQTATSMVKLWDVASGKELDPIKAPEGVTVSGVAFDPAGKVLAFCGNGNVHVCRTDGATLYQIRTADFAVGVAFSPDGKTLATRGRNQQARLWEVESGKELFPLGDPATPGRVVGAGTIVLASPLATAPEVRDVAFSPDGTRVVTAAGGTVRLWTAATGKELPLSDGHHGPLTAVALSPDGKTAVSWGTDGVIRRWEAATGKPLGAFPLPPGTTTATLSADGRTVAAAGTDNTIRLIETATGNESARFKGHARGTSALAFSPDGKVLAERGGDGLIRLYDPSGGGELRQFAAEAAPTPTVSGAVVVAAPGRLPGAAASPGLVFSPDGKLLASSGGASGAVLARPVAAVAPPGARTARGTINLFDVATGKVVRKIELIQTVVSYAFSPDGRVLAAENADESISLFEVASGKERARLGKAASAPAAPVAMPAQVRVAVAGGAGFAEPAGPATLAFSPDGRALVGRGPDRSVRVWDATGGMEVGQFKGHDGRVGTLAFSPDGKAVASGSTDTTVLLWDAAALRKDLPAPQPAELPDGAADGLWADLAAEDAGKAYQSVLKLVGDPRQAVPFLAERLKPAPPIDLQKLERWVADLESEKFAVRQEASANLVKAGEQAVPALQKVLASKPAIETRLRVEGLLDRLTGTTLTAEQVRFVRAAEALERMGTPEARGLLQTLAGGAAGALPTREARAALDRMNGR